MDERPKCGFSFCEYLLKDGGGVIISTKEYRGDQLEYLATCAAEGNTSLIINDIRKVDWITNENIKKIALNGKGHVIFDLTCQ